MKIFYSPEYCGHLYIDFSNHASEIAFDCEYRNTDGLIHLLGTLLGVYQKHYDYSERLAGYYTAFSKHIKAEGDKCVFFDSYTIAPLSTVKKCLQWRDELAFYGWTANLEQPSSRLQFLAYVENDFSIPGRSEYCNKVLAELKKHPNVLEGSEIIIPFEREILPPLVQEIFNTLTGCKVSLDNRFSPVDFKNIEVWHFPSRTESMQYLATLDDDMFDLWINADNKLNDNYLRLSGHPVSGSSHIDANPRIFQLAVLGLSMLKKPLNVEHFLEWLNLPINPIGKRCSGVLADTIVSNGGYSNEACKKVIDSYIKGEYKFRSAEQQVWDDDKWKKHLEETAKMREDIVKTFLPDINWESLSIDDVNKSHSIPVSAVKKFVTALTSWCGQRVIIMQEESDNPLVSQLSSLQSILKSLSLLLETESRTEVEYELIEGWISNLYESEEFLQYEAKVGCREVISNEGAIVDPVSSTIWCDVYGSHERQLSCSFLSDWEREKLSKQINLYDKDAERAYNLQLLQYPLTHTKEKLVLVTCDKNGSEKLEKHPFMIMLESHLGDDFKSLVSHPKVDSKYSKQVDIVDNRCEGRVINVKNADKFRWPSHESASSLESIIQHPLDYVLDTLTGFHSRQVASMMDINRTMGNVAHAVIQAIFSPSNGAESTDSATAINILKSSYDRIFMDTVQAKGAILLQKENILSLQQLNRELKRCISNLIDIIKCNSLVVKGCEYEIEETPVGMTNSSRSNIPLKGYVDMTLLAPNGDIVVFDFKWSNSNFYVNRLEDDASIQLAIYAELLKTKDKSNVSKKGYFLMPRGILYSTDYFESTYSVQVKKNEDVSNPSVALFEKIRNSFRFRCDQLCKGEIEVADGLTVGDSIYGRATDSSVLVPLSADKQTGTVYKNSFTNYPFFNH